MQLNNTNEQVIAHRIVKSRTNQINVWQEQGQALPAPTLSDSDESIVERPFHLGVAAPAKYLVRDIRTTVRRYDRHPGREQSHGILNSIIISMQ